MGLLGKILKAYTLLLYWRISLNGSVVQLLRESLFSAGPPWRKLIRVISTGPNFQETLKLLSSGEWLGLAASLEEASSFSADSRKDLELLWYFLSSCSCKEGDSDLLSDFSSSKTVAEGSKVRDDCALIFARWEMGLIWSNWLLSLFQTLWWGLWQTFLPHHLFFF